MTDPTKGSDGERGATLIEYGIIVSILLISMSTVIGNFQESEAEKVTESQGRVGTPPEVLSYNAGAAGNPTPPAPPPPPPASTYEATVSLSASTTTQSAQKWTAIVEMVTVDATSAPILDAQITGTWTLTEIDGSTTTATASCNTDSSGVCNISKWNLRRVPHSSAIVEAAFVIDNVTGQDVVPAAGTVGLSVTVFAP